MRKLALILSTCFCLRHSHLPKSASKPGSFSTHSTSPKPAPTTSGWECAWVFACIANVMFEGELAYDYGLNFNEAYTNVITGDIVAIEHTSIGVTHGLLAQRS